MLETTGRDGGLTRKPYFILIGNNTDCRTKLNAIDELIKEGQYTTAQQILEKTFPSQDEEIKQIVSVAERIAGDTETGSLDYFSYTARREHLQFLSDIKGYPIAIVPFTAARISGLLSERQGLYTAAKDYYNRNLINYPHLYDNRTAAEYIRILKGVENTNKTTSSARRLKHTFERRRGDEKDGRTKYLIAVLEKYTGKTARAEELFQEISCHSNPSILNQWAQYQLAVLDKKKGNYDKAIEVFEGLLSEDRERINDYARFQLGESYFLKRDFRQALLYYERIALTHSPTEDRPFALYQTGICYLELNRPEQAIEYLDILNKDYPQHRLTRQGMYLYAEASYRASKNKRWGNDPTVELEVITATLKEVIEKYPNTKESEDSYYLISQSIREVTDELNKRGQHNIAKRTYAQLVGEDAVGLEEKDEGESEETTEIQLQERETNPIIKNYLQLADRLYAEKKYEEAIKMYQRILQESPRSSQSPWAPDSLERMGVYYWQGLDNFPAAISAFTLLMEKYPEDNLCRYACLSIAEIYQKQENYQNARIWYKTVIDKYPGTDIEPQAKEKLAVLNKLKEKK